MKFKLSTDQNYMKGYVQVTFTAKDDCASFGTTGLLTYDQLTDLLEQVMLVAEDLANVKINMERKEKK